MEKSIYSNFGNPLEVIERLGNIIAKSGMFGCSRTEQGQVLAAICVTENKSLTFLLRTYDIINARFSKKAMAAGADFRKAGGKYHWINAGEDGQKATVQLEFEGHTIVTSYTLEDAKRQMLVKDDSNWKKTPANMLRARCLSNAIGMICPEIYAGDDSDPDEEEAAPAMALKVGDPQSETLPLQTSSDLPTIKLQPIKPVAVAPPEQEKELAAMGLAPALTPPPVPPVPKVHRKIIEIQPSLPAQETESQQKEASKPPKPGGESVNLYPAKVNPLIPPSQLSPEMVEAIGQIIKDKFLVVALWMIKEQWLPKNITPLTDEITAAKYLQANLYLLAPARAKRILVKQMNFMRAIEEIKP